MSATRSRPAVWPRAALGVLAAGFAVVYALVPILRYRRLETPSWDNAIFEQAIRGYARLEAPIVDIKGPGFHILGDHFSPITALLAPFYRLFPDPHTLFLAQAVLIAVSILPVGAAAIRRLGPRAGLAVATAYALGFGIQSAVAADFHEVAFAVPILAFAGVAWMERRWRAVAAWSVLLLLVKEDLGLTVAAIGAVCVLSGGRRVGLILLGVGVVAAVVILVWVIPAFNATGSYGYLNQEGSAGAIGPAALFSGLELKARTLGLTFGITGFLALRSPWVLVALPTLGWRMATDQEFYWGTAWHYSLVLMPVVFVALLDGLSRSRESRRRWVRGYARAVPALVALIAVVTTWWFPFGALRDPDAWQASPRTDDARAVLEAIPRRASVETDIGLITHLVGERRLFWTGTVGEFVPDYVLVDALGGGWGATAPDAVELAQSKHPRTSYELVLERGGYQLARRVS